MLFFQEHAVIVSVCDAFRLRVCCRSILEDNLQQIIKTKLEKDVSARMYTASTVQLFCICASCFRVQTCNVLHLNQGCVPETEVLQLLFCCQGCAHRHRGASEFVIERKRARRAWVIEGLDYRFTPLPFTYWHIYIDIHTVHNIYILAI